MIDCVFISEFDIHKGCLIKHFYPEHFLFNENALAAYMIPDGAHKLDSDITVFKFNI